MAFETPCEDADLVEVEGQAGFRRAENGYVLRNLIIVGAGVRIGDFCQDVSAHNALAFGIDADCVWHIHINAA